MSYTMKEVKFNAIDFKKLCKKLDDFQNNIFKDRVSLKISALDGLENLEKIILMYDGNQVIACGALKPCNKSTAELARMYTDDAYRGQGLAPQIIKELLKYAKEKGYKKIVLDTWKASTSARKLYASLGFKERSSFDAKTFQNSFSTNDENIQNKIQEKLVFMELDIS